LAFGFTYISFSLFLVKIKISKIMCTIIALYQKIMLMLLKKAFHAWVIS